MTRRARVVLFLAGAAVVSVLLWSGFEGLSAFGTAPAVYRTAVLREAVPARHATSAVATVVFDVRGIDTLGEDFILFASVIGVVLLLRLQREEHEEPSRDRVAKGQLIEASDAIRVGTLGLVGPTVVVALWVVSHGHLSSGGGFQGGVVLAAALILIYLAGRYLVFRSVNPKDVLELAAAAGAASFVALGLGGLFTGMALLENVLPLGRAGALFSMGDIALLNLVVALLVSAGATLVIYEFLEQTLLVRGG